MCLAVAESSVERSPSHRFEQRRRTAAAAMGEKVKTGAGTQGMKRPAAATDATGEIVANTFTYERFSLKKVIAKCMSVLNFARLPNRRLKIATGCSGSGAPTIVARAILKTTPVDEILASESSAAKAHFMLKNAIQDGVPRRIFCDIGDIATSSGGPCFAHGGGGVLQVA